MMRPHTMPPHTASSWRCQAAVGRLPSCRRSGRGCSRSTMRTRGHFLQPPPTFLPQKLQHGPLLLQTCSMPAGAGSLWEGQQQRLPAADPRQARRPRMLLCHTHVAAPGLLGHASVPVKVDSLARLPAHHDTRLHMVAFHEALPG